ncbi:PKD domain-containing protein [Candidatus Bipolaricaulota bacterium]|nr:PKD domain-containing protein [Candidatus Bipolaricaulota bacterium]
MKDLRIGWRLTGVLFFLGVLTLGGCMLFQPKVVVDFEAMPTSGLAPHLVDFTPIVDETVVAYQWDFGDGNTSTEPAPAHIYRTQGTFTVALTVQFADGKVADVVKADLVEVAARLGKLPPLGPIVWLDKGSNTIYKGPRSGGEISTVVRGSAYHHLADIDVGGGKVYWTTDDKVERANLDGSGRQTLHEGNNLFQGIAVDPVGGKVYWIVWPEYLGGPAQIWRANLNGSGARAWASKPVATGEWTYNHYVPWLLAIDPVNDRLYWYEKFLGSGGFPASKSRPLTVHDERSIHWTNLDAFTDHTAFTDLPASRSIALDVGLPTGARNVYWTDPAGDSIRFGNAGETYQSSGLMMSADTPIALAIDANEGKIYWSSSDGIHRANLWDGSGQELIYPGVRADALALEM